MNLFTHFKAGVVAVAVSTSLAGPAFAQSAGTATNVMFPIDVMSAGQGGGGGLGGFEDRVRQVERNAPNRESFTLIGLDSKEGKGHFNAIFGGIPEGAGLSGGIQITSGESFEGFEVYGNAAFSVRAYRLFEGGLVVGRDGEGWGSEARFRYLRRPRDNFYGVGPFSTVESGVNPRTGILLGGETNYDLEQRSLAATLHYDVSKELDLGVYVEHKSSNLYEGTDDADPSIFRLYQPYYPGNSDLCFPDPDGIRPVVPGLEGTRYLSYGAYIEYDARNNEDGLTKGGYAYGRVASHDSTADRSKPGIHDYGWTQATFDLRGYLPLFGNRTSLAGRYFTDLNRRKGGSAIPFYSLPRLGGNATLRGFDTFRFTGQNAALFQAELRQTVWRQDGEDKRGVDVIAFSDLGQVWGQGYPPPNCAPFATVDPNLGNDFDTDNFEVDVGVGVSYRVSKGFAIRVDFAHSNEDDKIRLTFSRGF